MRPYILLAATAIALLMAAVSSFAQPPLDAQHLTNRKLGLLNDASAAGWNPAFLGLQLEEWDLLVATNYDQDFDFGYSLFGVFGRFGPIGGGFVDGFGDSVAGWPGRYTIGAGLPVYEEQIFAGAGVQWLDGQGFGSAEWTIAGAYRPFEELIAGITLGNLTGNNDGSLWFDLHGAYAIAPWLTAYAGLRQDDRDTFGGFAATTPTIGASVGLADNAFVFSAQFDANRSVFRLGLEAALGFISVGSFNDLTDGEFGGGVAIGHWSSTTDRSIIPVSTPTGPLANPMGWAPERAFRPAGVDYTVPASNNDALRNQDAIELPCTGSARSRFDSSIGLFEAVRSGGASYAPLASRLSELSPRPADLIRNVRRKIYTPQVRNTELKSGDSLALLSKQGHNVGIQSVDATRFPTVSVILRVTDDLGRTVPGLGVDDFQFRDPALNIVSVRPTDSTFSVPLDVVILVDCSGSMHDEIESVRANVERFVDLLATRGASTRIGGVLYGSVIYDTLHPTADIGSYKAFLKNASAIGGDEITTLAVQTAAGMNFRPDAQRVFVMITDDWVVQNNARLTESDLVPMLWDARARLYSVITTCKNNSAVTTRLALGREYDITMPFTSILNEIGSDITTTYELVYQSPSKQEEVIPKVTLLRGHLRDEDGAPVGAPLSISPDQSAGLRLNTNGTTGEYETEITEGIQYAARAGGGRYLPLEETVDLTRVNQGDTVTRDFVLRFRPTLVIGRVLDENGVPITAEVRIEEASTLVPLDTAATRDGVYQAEVTVGSTYRLTPYARNYIPFPEEITVNVPRGTDVTRDLRVMSIDAAIASGAVFPLKNIFFDYDKSDLKPESFGELDRLIGILREYPVIKVEVGAHTDSRGSDGYNASLSGRRAASVVDYLKSQGIGADRLFSKGYGESVPVATNDTDEGRALNRRVEFKLVK